MRDLGGDIYRMTLLAISISDANGTPRVRPKMGVLTLHKRTPRQLGWVYHTVHMPPLRKPPSRLTILQCRPPVLKNRLALPHAPSSRSLIDCGRASMASKQLSFLFDTPC